MTWIDELWHEPRAGGTLVIILRFKKVPEPVLIVAAGLLGLVLKGGLGR